MEEKSIDLKSHAYNKLLEWKKLIYKHIDKRINPLVAIVEAEDVQDINFEEIHLTCERLKEFKIKIAISTINRFKIKYRENLVKKVSINIM